MDRALTARRLACAGLLTALLVPAAASAQEPARIASGVAVGSVDLAGLTAAEATARLTERLGPRLAQPVVVRVAARRFPLDPAGLKVTFDAAATARRALAAAGTPGVSVGGGASAGTEVAPVIRHAHIPVAAFARTVAAAVARAPQDASLTIGLRRLRLHRARLGVGLDTAALAARIDAVLDDPSASRLVEQRVLRVRPAVNANDIRARYRTVITVSKHEFKLRLFKDLRLRKSYSVAVGRPIYPTPEGRFSIVNKQVNPVWSVPNSPWAGELGGTTVAGGTAANPLKARWMGIVDGVGIHGTGEDWSIGSAASHGCVRMHVADVIDLYPRVPVGTTVLIR